MREAYSQRMLNPFHGVVNVVQVPGADAVSRDGVHWNLYIQGDSEAVACADGSRHQVALPDVKYGSWSAAIPARRPMVALGRSAALGNGLRTKPTPPRRTAW